MSRKGIEKNLQRNILEPVDKDAVLGYKGPNPIRKNRYVLEHESHI